MLRDIIQVLACPHCGAALALDGRVAACAEGHAFDVAREGYLNLLPGAGAASSADTPAMVRARRAFLDAGHFAQIAQAVASVAALAVPPGTPGIALDAGSGTGYLLGALLGAQPERHGLALDISKHAVRVAARSHVRVAAVVADVWSRLPLQDSCAAVVLNAFAPRNAEEFWRVLSPGGGLIVVTPREDHLAELVGPLRLVTVDPRKRERLSAKLSSHFEPIAESPLTYGIELAHAEQIAAVGMGPSAAHFSAEEIAERVETMPERLGVTVSVDVGAYRRRENPSRNPAATPAART